MLDLRRYLLGVAEIGLLVGFAWLGAAAVRRRLLPELDGRARPSGDRGPRARAPALGRRAARHALGWFEAGAVSRCRGRRWVGTLAAVGDGGGSLRLLGFSPGWLRLSASGRGEKQDAAAPEGPPRRSRRRLWLPWRSPRSRSSSSALEVKPKLSTGMTGFDSTWYHGPFAAGFFQSGDTWGLHFIAPQFLAWFYPANSECFHAVGMLAFDRDLLSPLLNLGWFVGCLVACWCIGRPYRVAPWSLALGAIALSVPALLGSGGGGAQRHRRDLLPACCCCDCPNAWAARAGGRSAGLWRPGRSSSSGWPRASPPGPSSTSSCPRQFSSSAWSSSRRGRQVAGAGGGWAWPPSPAAATGTCATSPTPATRCPGSTPRPDLAAGARPGAGRARRPQRPRLPDRRLGLVGLVPARPPRRPRRSSGRCSSPSPLGRPAPLPSARPLRPIPIADRVCAGLRRPRRRARLADRPDLRLRPRGHAPRLRVRPPLPRPSPGPRPRPPPGALLARLREPRWASLGRAR